MTDTSCVNIYAFTCRWTLARGCILWCSVGIRRDLHTVEVSHDKHFNSWLCLCPQADWLKMFCMDLSLWDDNLRNVLICLCWVGGCSTLTEPSYLLFPFSFYAKLISLAICPSFIIWHTNTESSTALFLISNTATKQQHNWFPTMTSVYTCLQGL